MFKSWPLLSDGFWEGTNACPLAKGGIDMKSKISAIYYINGSSALGPARLAASQLAMNSAMVSDTTLGSHDDLRGAHPLPVMPMTPDADFQSSGEDQGTLELLWSGERARKAPSSSRSLKRSRSTLLVLATLHLIVSTVLAAVSGEVNFKVDMSLLGGNNCKCNKPKSKLPKVAIMVGLANGSPASPSALQDEAAWILRNYIEKFGAQNFVGLDGKPVLIVLDTRDAVPPKLSWNVSESFSVRWMGAQLQSRPSLGEKEGFWSWMDGSYDPVPAIRAGRVEALTVTPGFFNSGWGFFPLNLLAASLKAYSGAVNTTLIRVMSPMEGTTWSKPVLTVAWAAIGTGSGGSFEVLIDGKEVASVKTNKSVSLDLKALEIKPGAHRITVIAKDGWTRYELSNAHVDDMLTKPIQNANASASFLTTDM
eukprot:g7777.t1